jgi:hypothetical protein
MHLQSFENEKLSILNPVLFVHSGLQLRMPVPSSTMLDRMKPEARASILPELAAG